MNGILDSMMAKPKAFSPESVGEYTALQLAKRLGDADRPWKYLSLLDHHPLPAIRKAFSHAQASGLKGSELITVFEEALSALTNKEDDAT